MPVQNIETPKILWLFACVLAFPEQKRKKDFVEIILDKVHIKEKMNISHPGL